MASELFAWVDHVLNPAVRANLDVVFPQYGFRRKGNTWVASDENAVRSLTGKRADRLKGHKSYCVINSGAETYTFLALANGGQHPSGPAYYEAVRLLAERVGLTVPERELSPEAVERAAKKETQRTALEAVLALCRTHLETDAGAEARHYLTHKRGLDAAALERFGIGLYPSVATVEAALRDGGYPVVEDGYRKTVEGLALIDRMFEGRIVVPWNDAHGRPEAIVGRALSPEIEAGKKYYYLAGSQRTAPLCFDLAQEARDKHVVIVEGIFDAIAAQAHGDARVIAVGSVSLSGAMADTLARYRVTQATICLDPDASGEDGALRVIDTLIEKNIAAYIAPPLPDGMDPDELLVAKGLEAWKAHIARAESGFTTKARALITKHKGPEGWTDIARDACLDEAVAYEAKVAGPQNYTSLDTYFLPVIAEGTGVSLDAIALRHGHVRERALQAKEAQALSSMVRSADAALKDGDVDTARKLLADGIDKARKQTRRAAVSPVVPVADELDDHAKHLAKTHGREFIGLQQKTLREMDRRTLGLRGLMLLAAAPGIGKTTLALQMGLDVVKVNPDAAFILVALEMSRMDMLTRIKANLAGINTETLARGGHFKTHHEESKFVALSGEDLSKLREAEEALAHYGRRILILDEGNMPIPTKDGLKEQVDMLRNMGVRRVFIVVDYLQVWPVPEAIAQRPELEQDKWRIGELKALRDDLGADGAILAISEANKESFRGNDSLSAVMGTARGTYTPDMVFLLREESAEDVLTMAGETVKKNGSKNEAAEQADKARSVREREFHDNGFDLQRLVIVKGRDGVKRGTVWLRHDFTTSRYSERTEGSKGVKGGYA